MSITSIDHALKGLVRTGRIIIARYREDCPRSKRPRISIAHAGRAWAAELLAARQGVQHSVDGMFKCIPFKGKAAFWRILGLRLILCVFLFQALICKHIMQWIDTPASRWCKLYFWFLTYVSSSCCCIKTIGLISIRFTGIDQLHITYKSTKIYTDWMSASSWFLCLKNWPLFLHAHTCR